MEVVVYLALFVLAAVFCFSLFILIVMCRRRASAMKQFQLTNKLTVRKLDIEKVESITQLSPLIAQALSSNQWVYDVSGMLQHCVLILKMCHALTEKLSAVSLNSVPQKLNDLILTATIRVMPRFDDLLRTMAANRVDVRLIEARASSLVSACWALAFPFAVISPKHVDLLHGLLNEMEGHVEALHSVLCSMEQSLSAKVKNGRVRTSVASSLSTVLEETSLIEEHNKSAHSEIEPEPSIEPGLISDEAPADPSAN